MRWTARSRTSSCARLGLLVSETSAPQPPVSIALKLRILGQPVEVTSPAALCSNPLDNPVEVLPIPIAAAGAFQKVSTSLLGREQFTIPLTLALEYVERHREELERTFEARELASRCIRALTESRGE